jgi:hypothetical protein
MTPINFSLPGFFNKTGAGVAAFNEDAPPITDDLLVFFDPEYGVFSDDGHTLAVDGDNIRQIWDRASTGNTLNQTTATSQPIYDTTTFGNGIASIKSLNDKLIPTDALDLDTTTDWTFYLVYKKATHSNIYYWFGGTTGYPRTEHRTTLFQIRSNTGSGRNVPYTDNTDIKIMTITNEPSTGEFKMYINGDLIGEAPSGGYYANNPIPFTIGKLYANGTAFMNAGNVLFYTDIHDASQVSQVSNWLNTKYDIYIPPISVQTNLLYHLDPQKGVYSDAGSTLATDGQAIQQINEQSSSGIIATNTESGYQATYDVNSINGLNSIRLENDNAKDTYFLSSEISLPNHEWTTHIVYKKDDLSDSAVFVADNQNIMEDGANGYTYLLQGSAYSSYDGGDDWTVASFKQDKTNSGLWYYYINGVLMTKYSSGVNATQAIDRLFQRPSKRTGEYNVADMLVYGESQSFSDIGTIQNELNDKYSNIFLPIDNTLPSPPTIGSTTLEWYHNPDYNTYSDIAQTDAIDEGYVRSSKITTGDLTSMRQHTASKQMQYKTSVLPNGKSSYYKGGADYMNMSEEKVFTSSESFVAYSVHKRTNVNGNNAIFGKENDYDNVIMDWNGGIIYYKANSGTATIAGLTNTTNTVVRAYVIDRSANEFKVYENGVEIGSADTTAVTADTTFDIMFNRWVNGTGTIDHGITLLYRGLHDDTNVETVSDWLNDYYGNEIY